MTVDDDIRVTQSLQQQQQQQYLDFIEFCLAEYNTDLFATNSKDIYQSSDFGTLSSSQLNDINSRNKRKWSKNKIVDLNILNNYTTRLKDNFELIQERLILFKIKEVNQFTTYIPLDVLFQNSDINSSSFFHTQSSRTRTNYSLINMKKKLFVDMKTLKTLNKSKQINWSSSLISLYPIKTLGDGNCLCHAVLSYLVGMQDVNLALRDTLKNFMNDIDYTTELKYRWISYRKASDVANAIQVDDRMLDTEWSEIINMKSAQTDHNDSKNLDKSSSTLNSEFNSKAVSPSQSLIYLEDIHIFALANLLFRTIIVISLDTLRNIQPIHLRGIYLPLLRRPDECCKDPIMIAFHNFHFMPLLFPIDEDNNDSLGEIINTEKYFHFENVDEMDYRDLDNNDYEASFKFSSANHSYLNKTSTASTSIMMSTNTGQNGKRKKNRFFNTLPLIYYNLESMKIHFLKENEEKNSQYYYLNRYLNLVQLEITVDDLQPLHQEYLNENHTITVLCCYLHKDSRNKKVKHDGITTYLSFLNESIKKNGNRVVGNYKNLNDESIIFPSSPPSRMTQYTMSAQTQIPTQYLSTNEDTFKKCKLDNCNEKASDQNTFGYCSKCNKKNLQSNPTTPNPISKKEIEPEKETQQYQFVTSQIGTPIQSSSALPISAPLTSPSTSAMKREETAIPSERETEKTSAKLAEINRKIKPIVTRKLDVCVSPRCKNIVQNYNDEHCISCRESLIADATRSSSAASTNLNQQLVNKQIERVVTSRTSTTKSPVQIPVKHETSTSSTNNKMSAYNLTSDSKLYKTSSMLYSNFYDDLSHNSYKVRNVPINTPNYEDYDTTPSAYGPIHDLRRPVLRDSFNGYQTRNVNFPYCSNCKYIQVDPTGASSFCNICRMSPYSKIYF